MKILDLKSMFFAAYDNLMQNLCVTILALCHRYLFSRVVRETKVRQLVIIGLW
jgi:hypothetical protein